jgi:hypothetical protein
MSYRPITDVWLLARSKVKYYGAYPAGFLGRARDLLGVDRDDPVLHVCAGRVRDYPYRGFGPNDQTLDLNEELKPDYLQDARDPLPFPECYCVGCSCSDGHEWGAVLIDRPYTPEDADHYKPGASLLPDINKVVANALKVAPRVGVLDYFIPRPPKGTRFVACVGVIVGFGNRGRFFTVFSRE